MRNPNSWTYKDKQVTELSGHGFVDEDADYESEDSLFEAFQPKRKPTGVGISVCVSSLSLTTISY